MPLKDRQTLATRHQIHDPLTAVLDADGTYICTAYNSRCYIIQKVTPPVNPNLNPDADSFESKSKSPTESRRNNNNNNAVKNKNNTTTKSNNKDKKQKGSYEMVESEFPPLEGSSDRLEDRDDYSLDLLPQQLSAQKWNVYMNGDVGKVPSGAVYTASPEPHPPASSPEFSLLNGDSEVEGGGGGGLEATGESGAGSAPEAAPDPQPPIPLDQLKQMLSSQLEYYFSRENLANDTYLLSQMDNDQYVPIWTVANFNQVKKLTNDIKLITEVLRESPNVQVDEEGIKVRPNHKRCIVILREIPDSTPLEEVKGLFSGKGCPKLISCEFAHNNSWYVTFENDEDAQKAYRFLREEVREFQGKPIMARIKAKPMNRLPLPPGIGAGGIALKNGFRTPPAPATTGPGVYDPSVPYSQPPQRYPMYNGSSIPPNVNYNSSVQIYVTNFQQHQPFYPPNMLPTWGPTSPAYFDIGSVFSVNGLAPQGGPFTKSHTTRFTPRNSRQKKPMGLEARTAMSDSGIVRKPVTTKENSRFEGQEIQRHEDDSYRPPQPKDQVLPPRRRRKEDEGVSRAGGSPGPQFDLEADAFPPLPGGHGPSGGNALSADHTASPPSAVATSASSVAPSAHHTAPSPSADHPQWAENRLSDVVKGSVKARLAPDDSNNSNGGFDEKDSLSPTHMTPHSTSTLPQTPDKLPAVRGSAGPKVLAGSGEKGGHPRHLPGHHGSQAHQGREDSMLNKTEETSGQSQSAGHSPADGSSVGIDSHLPSLPDVKSASPLPHSAPPLSAGPLPVDTHHLPSSQSETGMMKLSYAQVAQHHLKEKQEKEKTAVVSARTNENSPSQAVQQPSNPGQGPLPPPHPAHHHSDDEKTHNPSSFHYSSKGDFGSRGRGGGVRGAPRRRDNIPRQYNSRQRSPK